MKKIIEIVSAYEEVVKESDHPVVVIMIANWCGTCQIMVPILENLANQYKEKIKFVMVDIDEAERVIRNYGSDKLPILLLFKEGEMVDQLIGTISESVLEMKLKRLLEISSTNNITNTK
jgi:thioredoxin 1